MDNANIKKIIEIKNKIEESIATKKPLIFTYIKWNEYIPEERRVVFQKMYSKNERFYAVGYCLKRRDKRTFRLDRIEEINGFALPVEEIPASVSEPEIPAGAVPLTEKFEEIRKQREIKKAENRGCFITFIVVLIVCGGLVFGFLLGNYPGMWEKVFGEKDDYYVASSPISYIEIKGYDRNNKQPELINIDEKYRGYTIEKEDSYYMIKGVKEKYPALYDAVVKINTVVFTKITGIKDEELLSIYIEADTNKNGFLSWEEIKSSQMRINREFEYISNDIALRPDEFIKAGGGDCEDWALFTAGLLRFWNYETYIGSLNFKDNYHAVTLVKVKELPFRFKGYKITSAEMESGETLPEGIYTCIDYYRVGRVTKASGRKPRLIGVSNPEWCHGRKM